MTIDDIAKQVFKHVKNSYVSLREQEIRERAYYLWLQRGCQLWDADRDWYCAIEDDINAPANSPKILNTTL